MQQQRYWNHFVQIVGQSHYLHIYREKSEETERIIATFLAVSSSASIAGWAVWHSLSWLWGTVIAASQVLSACRSHLPYARRAEVLREATSGFKLLAMRIECNWFRIAEGELSEENINDLITAFLKEQFDIEDKLFSKITLAHRSDIVLSAEQSTSQYFTTFYGQQF